MMNTSLHRSCLALLPGTLPIFYTGSQRRFTPQVSGRLQSCILWESFLATTYAVYINGCLRFNPLHRYFL